ncbi:hypothetical protein P154DRAFT_184699 [Amniculicola lignicola CBS 123094]|uniref:Uncharacterized protein n=1 Tax=Amniculicola lignicola CBS 123094 TaxID=1392246 RepID=A0A6A5X0N0_9PLEO|nr:hypothetical protein P154DRAFT_184699 [Amniculicola lignicola CBS 123094]
MLRGVEGVAGRDRKVEGLAVGGGRRSPRARGRWCLAAQERRGAGAQERRSAGAQARRREVQTGSDRSEITCAGPGAAGREGAKGGAVAVAVAGVHPGGAVGALLGASWLLDDADAVAGERGDDWQPDCDEMGPRYVLGCGAVRCRDVLRRLAWTNSSRAEREFPPRVESVWAHLERKHSKNALLP